MRHCELSLQAQAVAAYSKQRSTLQQNRRKIGPIPAGACQCIECAERGGPAKRGVRAAPWRLGRTRRPLAPRLGHKLYRHGFRSLSSALFCRGDLKVLSINPVGPELTKAGS